MKISRYLTYFLIFNIVIALAPGYLELTNSPKSGLIPYFWQLFAAFSFLTLVTGLLSYLKLFSTSDGAVMTSLGSVAVKLLLWMIIAFIYIRNVKVGAADFLLDFFYLYLLNSVFEIYCLLRNLRNQNLR